MIRTPTQPTDERMIVAMSELRTAWARRTPVSPITYSPSVIPTSVCFTTSPAVRLKRVMSGVITAPAMKPPATMVVPARKLSSGPAGADVIRSDSE